MTRYYLIALSIEGFRGINNVGDPLRNQTLGQQSKFNLCTEWGWQDIRLQGAIRYAIFDEVPRLAELQSGRTTSDVYQQPLPSRRRYDCYDVRCRRRRRRRANFGGA